MVLFAVSIFLSAFLLFQLQPMIGKFILPWFGGTPAVWSTVMLFFQFLLTGGYAYAYWLTERVNKQCQFLLHVSLIAVAFLILITLSMVWESPVTPDASWKPESASSPVFDIFKLLAVSVGLPYFILAANGPLMQAWFSRMFPNRAYARLYALSNLGSLLGLLTYPILIEPFLPLRWQGWAWALGFLLFGLVVIWIASRNGQAEDRALLAAGADVGRARPSLALKSLWIALSGTASLFLLSVTNQITQEVAVIPFLWVLPLALYLLSFILTFSGENSYPRKPVIVLFLLSAGLTLFVMLNATSLPIHWQVLAYCILLFSACMICHGELYLLRPPAHSLTTFYLMVSIGGAFGGVFVSLLAPMIFNGYWEFFVGLATTISILLTVLRRSREVDRTETKVQNSRARFIYTTFCLVTLMLAGISRFFSGA
ncbi:MAG TPA: hypothetical protein VFH34_08610, partial [Anaerolineales bacterium]|nr:hypothetical protein [Anaerolineales bacterium]